jgi:predicted metalloprotease with PDZ domain
MSLIEIDSVAFSVLLKLLSHSYMHDWNDRNEMATYPPVKLTETEKNWFVRYKETGELNRDR